VPLIEQPLMASYDGRVEGVLVRGMQRPDILANKPTLRGKVRPARSKRCSPAAATSRSALGSPRRSAPASAARSA
jgi:lipoprotein-releasing system permease protein